MKNIHILQTDKPSRLISSGKEFTLLKNSTTDKRCENIYITSDEEIKDGDWMIRGNEQPTLVTPNFFWDFGVRYYKIILTTDKDLIKDGIQAIDDEFLEWFVKNPTCEFVKVNVFPKFNLNDRGNYGIIIPKEEPNFVSVNIESATGEDLGTVTYIPLPNVDYVPKQETLEVVKDLSYWKANAEEDYIKVPISVLKYITELENRIYSEATEFAEIDLTNLCYYDKRNPDCSADDETIEDHKKSLLKKDKTCSCDNCFYGRTELTEQLIWQQERMYSEEEVRGLLIKFYNEWPEKAELDKWFEQNKKK